MSPHLITPRDWMTIAVREALQLTGTPEGKAKLAEAARYRALADEIDRLNALVRQLKSELSNIHDSN